MHNSTINARIDVLITYAMNMIQLSIYGLKCAVGRIVESRRRFVCAGYTTCSVFPAVLLIYFRYSTGVADTTAIGCQRYMDSVANGRLQSKCRLHIALQYTA